MKEVNLCILTPLTRLALSPGCKGCNSIKFPSSFIKHASYNTLGLRPFRKITT